jgi:hypothetical protein
VALEGRGALKLDGGQSFRALGFPERHEGKCRGRSTETLSSHMLMSVTNQPARNLGTNQCAEPDHWTDTSKSETLTALFEPSGSGDWIYDGARQAKASRYQDGRLFVFKLASGQVRCPPLGPAHACPGNIGSREGLAAACSFAQPSQRGKRWVRRDRHNRFIIDLTSK